MTHAVYVSDSWCLDDLIPAESGPDMEPVFADLETAAAALESKRPALVPEIEVASFVEILGLVEQLTHGTQLLDGYSILKYFADTQDQSAIAFRGRVDKALADTENRTLFFKLWWKALDDANAKRLLSAAGDNAYYLETLRSFAPYTLSEAEERVINLKNVHGAEGMATLYRMITGGLTFDLEMDEETHALTRSQLMDFVRDPSPELREAAYRSFLDVYGAHRDELAQIYKCIAADWHDENVVLRGISSPISARNLEENVPDDVVDVLLETCRDNAGLFQRYFRLKAGWLGVEKLRRYDLYAPLDEAEVEFPFADGVGLILESFRGFSPKLAELAERVLAEGHLDSIPRPGKRGGGVSWDALPGVTPWILMTYTDRVRDATTLAHELGHAVHALMAADHSVLTFSPPLPLAETASSFGQILLLEAMLEGADPKLRRTLLAKYVEDSYSQILRQAFRVLFEQEAHRMIAEGATPDEISATYMETLREQFGDSVELDDLFANEWLSIPHFYTQPFYDYSYAFGLLLVLGLYQRYKEEGEAFVPKYLKILATGGSKAPIAVLDEAGFDIRQREFWQGGFDLIAGMVDELESLQ
jgi:oligoendopeptidase F